MSAVSEEDWAISPTSPDTARAMLLRPSARAREVLEALPGVIAQLVAEGAGQQRLEAAHAVIVAYARRYV